MTEHVYLDWNATAPLRPEAREPRCWRRWTRPAIRRRFMPPAARRAGWWRRRASRSRRWSASRRARWCSPPAAPRPTCWRSRPALGETLLVSAIEHPSVRSGGRFAACRGDSGRRAEGVVDLAALRAACSRSRLAAAGVAHARQQRDRRDPAGRGGRRARACGGRPAACRCGAGAGPDRLRFQGARRRSDDAVGAQDRRSAGCRRADRARRADAGRR